MWHFSMSSVLHFEGWEESSVSICCVSGKQACLPLKSLFLVVLASLTGALVGAGVKAGLAG